MGAGNGLSLDSRVENISNSANKVPSSKPIVEHVCVEIAPNMEKDGTLKDPPPVDSSGKTVSDSESLTERLETNAIQGNNYSVATSQKDIKRVAQVDGDKSLNATTPSSTSFPVYVPPKASVNSEINVIENRACPNMNHEKPSVVDNDIPTNTHDANQRPRGGLTLQNNVHIDIDSTKDDVLAHSSKSSHKVVHAALPRNPLVCTEESAVGPSIVSPFNKKIEKSLPSKISSQSALQSVDSIQSDVRKKDDSLHAAKAFSVSSSGVKEDKITPVQRIKKFQKSELALMYAPYILPGEKSLDDARSRLKTAIEQTRLLREAFTDHLYEKFRIALKPVPKSSDPLFQEIRSNPKVVHQRLKQHISMLQNEKELEKRISHQINIEFAAANNSSDTTAYIGGLPGVDNAEQLSWFGSGLSLVILPEDDVNEAELAARGIKERSPIDPETGGKLKDVSTAAAVAGCAMLDRVRKGSEIRKHRMQQQQAGKSVTDFFDLQLLQSNSIQPTTTMSLVSHKRKAVKRERETRTSKVSRSKGTTSLTSYLSLSPDVEGLRPSGRPSAVAHALINTNLKKMASGTSKESPFHHNVRHPFPQSKGASIGKHGHITDQNNKQAMLPSASEANERKEKIASSNRNITANKFENGASFMLQNLIRGLVSDDKKEKGPNCSTSINGRNRLRLKRKVSEIGILLKSGAVKQKPRVSYNTHGLDGGSCVDPYLALSVMQSIGLVQKSSSSYSEEIEYEECVAIDSFVKGLAPSDDKKSMAESGTSPSSKSVSINSLPAFRLSSIATELFGTNQSNGKTEISHQKESLRSEDRAIDDSQRSKSTKVPKEINESVTKTPSGVEMRQNLQSVNRKNTSNSVSEKITNSSRSNEAIKESKARTTNVVEQDNASAKFQGQRNLTSLESVHIVTNQQHPAYAAHPAGLITEQASPAFYQSTSNQKSAVISTVNHLSLQRQDIQRVESKTQFRPHSIQYLDSAQIQNHHQPQQASLHSGNFLQSGTSDIGDYFKNMHQMMPQSSFASSRPSDWFNIASQQNLLQGISCSPNVSSTLSFFGTRNPHMMVTAEKQQLQSQISAVSLSVSGISPSQDPKEWNEQAEKGSIRVPQTKNIPAGKVKQLAPPVNVERKSDNRDLPKPLTGMDVMSGPSSAPPKPSADRSKPTKHKSVSGHQLKPINQVPGGPNENQKVNARAPHERITSNGSNSNNQSLKASLARSTELDNTGNDKSSSDRHIIGKTASISKPPATLKQEKDVHPLNHIELKMNLPSQPAVLTEREARLVVKGYFHEAIRKTSKQDIAKEASSANEVVDTANNALCEFLIKVGAAIPIPKALISTKVRDRLGSSVFRVNFTNLVFKSDLSPTPFDIIVSIVTIWLWSHHQSTFTKAFAKSGRLDVDPNCQWLIKAAVEKATDVTVVKGIESALRQFHTQTSSAKDIRVIPVKIAKIVSIAINTGIRLDTNVNAALPNLDCLVGYLDDLRMTALRFRCQERVLLASLLAKRTRMSEAFSNAYASSMVRAGTALGYDDLGEIVQDEFTQTSSQLPFDILIDATGAWEDPCRCKRGYGANLDSDALLKRAHARAMIERSLKRLQDRYGITGGTQNAGPYSELYDQSAQKLIPSPRPSPRSGTKRKASFSSADLLKNMNAAATTALFNPNHFSAPFIWDDTVENTPYGRHGAIPNGRLRSPSAIGDKLFQTPKRSKTTDDAVQNMRSTSAIEWEEVARLFEDVKPIEKTSSSRAHEHNVAVPIGSTIFAPFCRKIDAEDLPSDSYVDEDEENMDDEHILAGHQKVLDSIKEKFDMMMKIRQEYQDRSRRLSFGR